MHRDAQEKTCWRRFPPAVVLGNIIAFTATATIVLRRRGYGIGGNTIVRCQQGHLFTTIWLPLASLKALRLVWWRFQWCPVGQHWSVVHPVNESDLTGEEQCNAREQKDMRIP
ncbi:MAG: hypothetical protein ACLQUT_02630 [Thermoleophilia bacterium]